MLIENVNTLNPLRHDYARYEHTSPMDIPPPLTLGGHQVVQAADNILSATADHDIKLIALVAALNPDIVADKSLAFMNMDGEVLVASDPETHSLWHRETEQLLNRGTQQVAMVKINNNKYDASVDGKFIPFEGDEALYKAILTAVNQSGSDIVTDQQGKNLRLKLATLMKQGADDLGQYWQSDTWISDSSSSPDFIIDMPSESESQRSRLTRDFLLNTSLQSDNRSESSGDLSPSSDTIIGMPSTSRYQRMGHSRSGSEDWVSFSHRHLTNAGLALARNAVSVGVTTALREGVRRGVLPLCSLPVLMSMAVAAIVLPVLLQLTGIIRDYRAGTYTWQSMSARIGCIGLVAGSTAALIARGEFSEAACALIAAVFVYVPVRDLAQYCLQLQDNNPAGINSRATFLSAFAYGVNQIIVDLAMDRFTEALEPSTGSLWANMLARSMANTAGETVDELTYRGITAWREDNPEVAFTLGLRPGEERTSQTATGHLLNTVAARASLFSAVFAGAFAATNIPAFVVVGIILGIGYALFFYCHAQITSEPNITEVPPRPGLSSSDMPLSTFENTSENFSEYDSNYDSNYDSESVRDMFFWSGLQFHPHFQ